MNWRISIQITLVLITMNSCLKDTDLPTDYFGGPSEFDIEFQSGSFTGRTYHLVSRTIYHDHEYLSSANIQKILSQPIEEYPTNTLAGNSFINWAWKGDTTAGQFSAIFANDPTISKSGDLQMIFSNGDEFISQIPKGAAISIASYGSPQGSITGSLTYTSTLDYKFSGTSKRETASLFIQFKIKRGPNL